MEEGAVGSGVDKEEVQNIPAVVVAHGLGRTSCEKGFDDIFVGGGEGTQEGGAVVCVFGFEAFGESVEEVLNQWDVVGRVVTVYGLVKGELDCLHIH